MPEMNDHEQIRSKLPALLAGTLKPREEAAVEAHLKQCPECARQLDVWQRLLGAMRRIPETVPTPARLARIAALARARRAEVLAEHQNRLVLAGVVLFGWAVSLLTLRGIFAASRWLTEWAGWEIMANPAVPVFAWIALTWMAALGLLPLLREHKESVQERVL